MQTEMEEMLPPKLTKNLKLFIRWFELNVLNTTKLLKISDMYDLLLITINLN
jgi:hypothetical protein